MDSQNIIDWLIILDFIVKYIIPMTALALSIIAFIRTRRINILDEKLKKMQLDEKEKELIEANKARIVAEVVKVTNSDYKLQISNSGQSNAYDVDFNVPDFLCKYITKNNIPADKCLKPGDKFLEILATTEFKRFSVITKWRDEKGREEQRENIVTLD